MSDEEVAEQADGLDELLEFLKESRGFDFTGYKRPSLTRRIRKRMQDVGVDTYPEYRAKLERHADEFEALFNTILINVTGFMRDADAWEYLETAILPQLAERVREHDVPLRVWSAGCATGEEAYSLAVALLTAFGEEQFRESVKIYATDADDDALRDARMAQFPIEPLLDAFGQERADRYFERVDSSYVFRADLRRSLIFGRHDLVQDPPISRIDLLVCRNTLMYFNADVQRRIVANFHFALNDGGYLFLGKSEALVTRTNLFVPVDTRRHIFVKETRTPALRPPLPAMTLSALQTAQTPLTSLAEGAFDAATVAQIAIDRDGVVTMANRAARSTLGIGLNQVGRPLRDLEASYRPIDLRSPVDQVVADRRPITLPDVEHRLPTGDIAFFDVSVVPIERNGAVVGTVINFQDVTPFRQLRDELERSQRDLEMAYEELQSAVEELETTNEELQSTNEELETTNEELHSTNEELETMNEELQSTNEELETVNSELRQRTIELDDGNHFLQSILRSLHAGVAVLAGDMTVRAWNREAEQLWGLRGEEVSGEHFLNLDIGLPVDALLVPIRSCLSGESPQERLTVRAVNRRGREIDCGITVSPLLGEGNIAGVIVMMEDAMVEESESDDRTGR